MGNICTNLKQLGFSKVIHEKGRKKYKKKGFIVPKGSELVIVFTDYINHSLAKMVKQEAKRYEVPVIYTNRSWSAMLQKLNLHGFDKVLQFG